MNLFDLSVDLSKIKKFNNDNNNNESSNKMDTLNDEINLLTNFNKLSNEFNTNFKQHGLKFKNELIKTIQNMRVIHGKILKTFYDELKRQGNFNHEEYYVLSMMNSSYTNTREIIKKAESLINGTQYNVNDEILSSINLNTDETKNNNDNDDNDDLLEFKKIDDEVKLGLPSMVLFYGDWCGHCKRFKPIWNEFKRVTNRSVINIISINDQSLLDKYNIDGVPTIKVFKDGKIDDYNNGRDIHSLSNYANNLLNMQVSKPVAA